MVEEGRARQGIVTTEPAERAARVVVALFRGIGLMRVLEPDAVDEALLEYAVSFVARARWGRPGEWSGTSGQARARGSGRGRARVVAVNVVKAGRADVVALSESLAAAFYDDPVMGWLLPDAASRARRLGVLFSVFLRGHFLRMDAAWTTPDRVGGALWAPPGRALVPPRQVARQLPGVVRVFGSRTVRALRMFEHVERHHPKALHWYLGVLGTTPARQGEGIGSSLLGPVLQRCDAEGFPAYLESSKESNIPFYRRHGFELRAEIALPDGGPTIWPMWREPVPG